MSLVSVIKEIKIIKNQILELRLMGDTNLEKEKHKELLDLKETFRLQIKKNIDIKNKEKRKKQNFAPIQKKLRS
jgi:hypothetical protein